MVAQRVERQTALEVAQTLVEWMQPHCERIEIGGSIRRGREDVKDIELVLMPKPSWFEFTDRLLTDGVFVKRHGWGPKSRFAIHVDSGINVDMFTSTPDTWGNQYFLRTGPGDANAYIMTWLKNSNAPIRSEGGYWWHYSRKLRVEDEQAMFRLLGIPYIEPGDRSVARYRQAVNDPSRKRPDFRQFYIEDKRLVGDSAPVRQPVFKPFTDVEMRAMTQYNAECSLRFYSERFASGKLEPTPERIARVQHSASRAGLDVSRFVRRWSKREKPMLKIDPALKIALPEPGATPLDLDTGRDLTLTVNDLVAQRIAVLGISGSGKTNSVAVLLEELLPLIPMTILDIEGDYWGLKARHDLLIVGNSTQADMQIDHDNAAKLAQRSVNERLTIILDMSEHDDEDAMFELLRVYFDALWLACKTARKPYCLVVEEAHEFMPQTGDTPLTKVLKLFAVRGRKKGVGMILSSQRSAQVDKNILTQTPLLFLHQVVHPIDMAIYRELVPWERKEVRETVAALEPGQGVVVHNHKPRKVQIRERHTFHSGATPTLDGSDKPETGQVERVLQDRIRELEAEVKRLKNFSANGSTNERDNWRQQQNEKTQV